MIRGLFLGLPIGLLAGGVFVIGWSIRTGLTAGNAVPGGREENAGLIHVDWC